MMGGESVIKRAYPSVVTSEAAMFADLDSFLSENQITGDLAQNIKLCVSEAFNNAVIHGNGLDTSKRVRLFLSANIQAVVADIIDEGQDGLASIKRRKKPSALDEDGRGMNLIFERADDVVLSTIPSGGLSLRLIFNRQQL